eukprot:3869741-Karenia_brevis.AAC.1
MHPWVRGCSEQVCSIPFAYPPGVWSRSAHECGIPCETKDDDDNGLPSASRPGQDAGDEVVGCQDAAPPFPEFED